MKYLLKTAYPCLIKTLNDFCELDENDTLELQDEKVIFVYPQSHTSIPFYINLSLPQESENFSIISQNGERFVLLEKKPQFSLLKREKINFGASFCTIEVSNNEISFETSTKKICLKCPHKCTEAKIFKIKNYAILQFQHDLYAYSMSSHRLIHFSGDELEMDGNNLKITKNFHDSLNREKSATYQFDEDIKIVSENFIVNHNQMKAHSKLIPFRLMESIKAKDFSFAYNCLSSNLKEKINQTQIKNFFGTISHFMPLSTTEFITICGHDKNYVKFDICQDKICDISIDKL